MDIWQELEEELEELRDKVQEISKLRDKVLVSDDMVKQILHSLLPASNKVQKSLDKVLNLLISKRNKWQELEEALHKVQEIRKSRDKVEEISKSRDKCLLVLDDIVEQILLHSLISERDKAQESLDKAQELVYLLISNRDKCWVMQRSIDMLQEALDSLRNPKKRQSKWLIRGYPSCISIDSYPSRKSIESQTGIRQAMRDSVISGRKTKKQLRALSSLSGIPRDILEEHLAIYKSDRRSIGHWQEEKVEEKLWNARIYVVTKSLAHSESALDDLSHLVEGADNKTVLPIFYGVDPSEVRYQTGSFAQAFRRYEIKYKDDPQKVKRWRAALTQLGNLSGWDSKGRPEAKLIQEVVDKVKRTLCSPFTRPAVTNVSSKPCRRTSSGRRKHDVFLSFRGEDTRLNFLDHLYNALIQSRISTFKDDRDLQKGETISTQLEQAIEGSKVCVVIVSPNYASSRWCLDELLKILERRDASKAGMKKETSMKKCTEEEQAHTVVDEDKTHKHKASLWNMEHNISRNKRKVDEFRLGVNYSGKWVGSVYIGGRTDEIVVPEDITYNELLDQLYQIVGVDPNEDEIRIITIDDSKSPANYFVEIFDDNDLQNFIDQNLSSDMHFKHPLGNSFASRRTEVKVLVNHDGEWLNSTYIGGKTKGIIISDDITYQEFVNKVYDVVKVDPNEYKLIMKTKYESNLPTQPVEITNDEALAFFIHDEYNSLDMSSTLTLCTNLEPLAFPNGRMESSQSSDATNLGRSASTYPSCVHCVTPDQVPYLHTQVRRSSPNVTCVPLLVQQQQPNMKTKYESNLPTQPVEITNDEALAFFIHDEYNSLDMSSTLTLCTNLEPLAFPNGRMESSQSSDATNLGRSASTYPSCVHCVTPDQVPYLHTQVRRSSPNVTCVPLLVQQQQPFYQQQQHFHQQTSQPFNQHYQPSLQQPQPPYQQLHPYYMHPQPQYQQPNPPYMQLSPPSIHQVPYSLRMLWNDATQKFQDFNFWQFCFVIILLGNILCLLKGFLDFIGN